MQREQVRTAAFIVFLLGIAGLTFWIFMPYLVTLGVAGTVTVIVYPVYRRICRLFRGYETIAAFVTVLLTVLIILIPLSILGTQIVQETADVYSKLSGGQGAVQHYIVMVQSSLRRIAPGVPIDLNQTIGQMVNLLLLNLQTLFASTVQTILHIGLGTIAFYYMLRDGPQFLTTLIAISPLSDRDDRRVLRRLQLAMNSIFRGSLAIAIIQGISTGIGLWIFGIDNAVLWGSMASLSALIPSIGTGAIFVPAVSFLFLTGQTIQAFGLAVWGLTAVGLVDNMLGPLLVGKGARIHPLFILFAVLGGVTLFGPAGFILGPLTLSLLFALIDIYLEQMGTARPQEK